MLIIMNMQLNGLHFWTYLSKRGSDEFSFYPSITWVIEVNLTFFRVCREHISAARSRRMCSHYSRLSMTRSAGFCVSVSVYNFNMTKIV